MSIAPQLSSSVLSRHDVRVLHDVYFSRRHCITAGLSTARRRRLLRAAARRQRQREQRAYGAALQPLHLWMKL